MTDDEAEVLAEQWHQRTMQHQVRMGRMRWIPAEQQYGLTVRQAITQTLKHLTPVDLHRWRIALPKLVAGVVWAVGTPVLLLRWLAASPTLSEFHVLGMLGGVALGSAGLGWLWRERSLAWAVILGFVALRLAAAQGWIPYSFGIPIAAFLGAFPANWVFQWTQKRGWARTMG